MAEFKKRYNPNRSPDWNYGGPNWKLSRSKIELFTECPRCFYLDNKLGTARPRGPAFTLNVAVDELFKKEFDAYRETGEKHPIMLENKIEAIPFKHEKMDEWRDNFAGITYKHEETGFTVSGAVDDIWVKPDGSLIVVDYKATSKDEKIESLSNSGWEDSYRRQMGVYQWLLEKNGFAVDKVGYFVYANARKDQDSFDDTLIFETTLVPCEGDNAWIDESLLKIKEVLGKEDIPTTGANCEFCPYREACGKKLLAIHNAKKQK
ncbi:MAG: PD-(D/E)XK nuclease family protein [Candidatus Nomurabacteria bacterium]|nr:PD-(D/E)XK nuclease family protein [Candidatus Nomurabacteria bacterium]USN87939.1 MAG: PD-(D/E)XK nuclease family protein [Candidatus Nomurabacteria bacterium]